MLICLVTQGGAYTGADSETHRLRIQHVAGGQVQCEYSSVRAV
jgi:hypothetical protein